MNKKIILAVGAGVVLAAIGFYFYDKQKVRAVELAETETRLNEDETLRAEIQKEALRRNVTYKQQLTATAKRIVK